MRNLFVLTCLLLMEGMSTSIAGDPALSGKGSSGHAVHVTIIYDNYQDNKNLATDWGFACLVEYQGHKLLFDAGREADLYRKNVQQLEIHPEEIPGLFISHEHGDHTAAMPWIIEMNPSVRCYFPASYAEQLQARGTLPPHSKGLEKPTHLYGPFYSTGDNFAAFREQGLVIKTDNGGILITGCGHPGAGPMIAAAEEELGIEIHTLVGGLHLMNKNSKEMEELAASLKEMGIRYICPTHCTGDNSIAALKSSFGEAYISGGTGKEIIIQ